MATTAATATMQHEVVSHTEWIETRKKFLAQEKEFTRLRDELSRQRRELPWERVTKPYTFEGPGGQETFADLFDGRSQLVIYHFMLGPGWSEGCRSCSYLADHFDGMKMHLAHRDVTFVVVSHAPYAEIAAFKERMGWKFHWVSSYGTDFNFDYNVSFSEEQRAKGVSSTTTRRLSFRAKKLRARVSLPRTKAARSITRIRRTRAGSTFWSAPTTCSTWCRRDAMRLGCRSRWRGCVITTSTKADIVWMRRRVGGIRS
ncbi:MAG TPA: DUF899 family protein [Terracidiphilus sp.]|nr:DUF899 family protein [Terracidiphilus sp.]